MIAALGKLRTSVLEECQKRKAECPNHEVSTLQQLLMNLHGMVRPGDRCSVAGCDLEQQQEVQCLIPGQVCECSRPVSFSTICDCFPKTPKAPKYLAGSVSVA